MTWEAVQAGLQQAEEDVGKRRRERAAAELRAAAVKLLRDTVARYRAGALAAVAAPVEMAATRLRERMAGNRPGRVQLGDAFEPGHVLSRLGGANIVDLEAIVRGAG